MRQYVLHAKPVDNLARTKRLRKAEDANAAGGRTYDEDAELGDLCGEALAVGSHGSSYGEERRKQRVTHCKDKGGVIGGEGALDEVYFFFGDNEEWARD